MSTDDTLRAVGLLTLGKSPPNEAVVGALRQLGEKAEGCDDLTREALRAGAIRAVKPHGFRASAVDAVLPDTRPNDDAPAGAGTSISLDDPKPWPEEVDGAELVADLVATFLRFLGLPDWAPVVLALWVLHSHAHDAADVSPLLALTSPEKRCGKTTTLTLLGALAPRSLPASNVTAPALFRAVEKFCPTLLVDEADTFLRDREDLRGVLNSGHSRAGAKVVRTVGDNHDVRCFSTWAPKAVAMIGTLPDTLADRSLVVPMRRREPGEKLERVRLDQLADLEPLRRQSWRWAQDNIDGLKKSDPDVPSELHDRAADNWRPLLAIADLAGGKWPAEARDAARKMAGADDGDDGSVRTLLLRDIRDLFAAKKVERLASSDITDALARMEERPWPEWGRSRKPITASALARSLKPFGVKPRQMKDAGDKMRGYDLADFAEVFRRYVPAEVGSEAVPPVPSNNGAGNRAFQTRYPAGAGTGFVSGENPHGTKKVPEVPARQGEDDSYELFEGLATQTEEFYSDPGEQS